MQIYSPPSDRTQFACFPSLSAFVFLRVHNGDFSPSFSFIKLNQKNFSNDGGNYGTESVMDALALSQTLINAH